MKIETIVTELETPSAVVKPRASNFFDRWCLAIGSFSPRAKLFASVLQLVALSGLVVYAVLSPDRTDASAPPARRLHPCVDDTGLVVWVRGECPTGSTSAKSALPDACDEGWCLDACSGDSCPPLESQVMCCCSSGPGGCFEIIETTMECGNDPSCDVLYCDYGYCDEAGESHCVTDP